MYRYDEAVRTAEAFIRRVQHPRPFVVKVLCLTLPEAVRMGFVSTAATVPDDSERDRQLVVTTLMDAMRSSNEPHTRSAAYETLKRIGAIQ